MYSKRKKFKETPTKASRLLDRWNQHVFFLMHKFPYQAAVAIEMIRKTHAERQGTAFAPTEESLAEMAILETQWKAHSSG